MKKLRLAVYLSLSVFTLPLAGDLNVNTSQSSTTGDSVTAWENNTVLGSNIFVSTQIAGTWGSSVAIANPATFPTLPVTAINNSGQMVVTWLGYDILTFNQSLYGSEFVSGSWVTTLISDPTSEYVIGNQQVKIADTGSIVVTWTGYIFSTGLNEARGIYAPTYGTWTSPVTIP